MVDELRKGHSDGKAVALHLPQSSHQLPFRTISNDIEERERTDLAASKQLGEEARRLIHIGLSTPDAHHRRIALFVVSNLPVCTDSLRRRTKSKWYNQRPNIRSFENAKRDASKTTDRPLYKPIFRTPRATTLLHSAQSPGTSISTLQYCATCCSLTRVPRHNQWAQVPPGRTSTLGMYSSRVGSPVTTGRSGRGGA